jgi:beta-lactamase regulating signal transducer with metallopeptidase domain
MTKCRKVSSFLNTYVFGTSLQLTDMKQIISLGKGRFVHVDSYGASHETRRGSIIVAAFAMIISALTVGAVLGIDITSPNTTTQHGYTHRTDR